MSDTASELGCSSGDMVCPCKNQQYVWGICDCTIEAWPKANATQVVAEAMNSCSCMESIANSDFRH